ncbi:hypothetical protein OSTOST_14856 [Ostertagia ostertagi]
MLSFFRKIAIGPYSTDLGSSSTNCSPAKMRPLEAALLSLALGPCTVEQLQKMLVTVLKGFSVRTKGLKQNWLELFFRFIEGRRNQPGGVAAAMILDHRVGLFFKNQNLMKSVREMDGLRNVDYFDFSESNRGMNRRWNEVNEYVKGVRMTYMGTASNPISFVAIGISKKPIKDLKDVLPNK